MKRFSFRLQKLLNLEEQREQQAKMTLHSLVNNLRAQEEILVFLQDSLYQNQQNLAGKEDTSTDSQRLMLYQNYIIALNERIEYQIKRVNQADSEVYNSRTALLNIQKERKKLEKLRDRNREDHTVVMRKTEIKLFDDISTCRQGAKVSGLL